MGKPADAVRGRSPAPLAAWNRSEAVYPRGTPRRGADLATARRAPERVAVRTAGKTLTYGQLGDARRRDRGRADALAASRPGDRVGLLTERDRHLLPAMVGTLSAPAPPTSRSIPSFPAERLRFMVADAGRRR